MSFLPVFLGFLVALLYVTSASDIPVSVGEKESNVTRVTSVFLPPSLSDSPILKETSEILSDDGSSSSAIEYHQMDGRSTLLASLEEEYEKLKKEVEERKASYTEARKKFDLKKEEDEKELAKMDSVVKERRIAEDKLKDEKTRVDEIKARVDKEEADLKAEEEKVADLQRRKEEVDKKDEDLKSLLMTVAQLEKEVKEVLGKCIEPPKALKDFWGEGNYGPNTMLCIKSPV